MDLSIISSEIMCGIVDKKYDFNVSCSSNIEKTTLDIIEEIKRNKKEKFRKDLIKMIVFQGFDLTFANTLVGIIDLEDKAGALAFVVNTLNENLKLNFINNISTKNTH